MKYNFKRVLFINFGGIGDEILFLPTLQTFRSYYPECKVDLLLEPRSAGAKELTNTIDEVIKYDVKHSGKVAAFGTLLKLIRQRRYDAVISSGSNKFIGLLLFLSGVKTRVGYDSGGLSRLMLSSAVALNKGQYATQMYHDLLMGIDITDPAPLPEVIVPQNALDYAVNLLGDTSKPFIAIHPGVSKLSIQKNIIKSWTEENWVEFITRALETNKYKIVLTGGPDDDEIINVIRTRLNLDESSKANFIDLYGKTRNLTELSAVIKQTQVLVCVDSAPMHIGVGVGTKIVAIFGPTDENKLLPKTNDFTAVTNRDINCRPCLWDKRNTSCDNISCLNISVDKVMEAVLNHLS